MSTERPGSDTSGSPKGSLSGASGSHRKERGAIAAQACENCRSRKQRCDEQRPRCSSCRKFQLECHYREPQPTKKDKTLVEILERIKGLETKIDNMGMQQASSTYGSLTTNLGVTPSSIPHDSLSPLTNAGLRAADDGNGAKGSGTVYAYAASVHQMLGWPVVQQLLHSASQKMPNINVAGIEQEGVSIVLGTNNESGRIPVKPAGLFISVDPSGPLASLGASKFGGVSLCRSTMQMLSKAYFDTFNHCHPILEPRAFSLEILMPVFNDGLTESVSSTLALVVFALGEVAIAGSQGAPITVYNTRPSGIKGGTISQPPGLALFNEARRRMGFHMTECSLETIQMFALAGIYCEACFSHAEFWRMTTSAALACQALVTGKPSELRSPRADLIKRCFWYCNIAESYFDVELGLPRSGLEQLEDLVGPPVFSGSYDNEDFMGTHASLSQEHFVSAIALRRLGLEAHTVLSNGHVAAHYPSGAIDTEAFTSAVKQLSQQLDQWRKMLPMQLRWRESQPGEFPNPALYANSNEGSLFPHMAAGAAPVLSSPSGFMYTTDLDGAPATYPYNLDIQIAVLRSRYYYSKLIVHRPCVYKALNYPEQMTQEDAEGVSECLKASLKWPVAMSPTCTRKRLVPCLFFWTQNMLGILVLLHLSQKTPILARIRATLCGESFELEASETVGLYIDWLRDLKSVDAAAQWAWEIVRAVYQLEE